MNEELEITDILNALRERIGFLAQENAILSAKLKKAENASVRNCGCSSDN